VTRKKVSNKTTEVVDQEPAQQARSTMSFGFSGEKIPRSQASTDFHLLTVRHVILRHVLVASRSSREIPSSFLDVDDARVYFAIHFKRTHLLRSTMFVIYFSLTYSGENPVKKIRHEITLYRVDLLNYSFEMNKTVSYDLRRSMSMDTLIF